MAFVIAEPCIDNNDQSCVEACPVDCIAADPARDRKFYIDPAGCIDCGACAQACPNSAIYPTDELPTGWEDFAWVDRTWYRDPELARGAIEQYLSAA